MSAALHMNFGLKLNIDWWKSTFVDFFLFKGRWWVISTYGRLAFILSQIWATRCSVDGISASVILKQLPLNTTWSKTNWRWAPVHQPWDLKKAVKVIIIAQCCSSHHSDSPFTMLWKLPFYYNVSPDSSCCSFYSNSIFSGESCL